MTNEQYYWNVLRPRMMSNAVAAYGQSKKIKLRINGSVIDGGVLENTRFILNSIEYDYTNYGKDFEFAPGTSININLIGDSGSQVREINGIALNPPEMTHQLDPFLLNSDATINVVYGQYWT